MITEVQPNETLDGRLQIEGVISRSGMASIYKAKDLMTGQAVAVKIPHQQFESDPASFARFQREAEIGKKLNHPNILRLLDVGEHSRPYIVMEYLEGKTLDQVMNKIRPLPISDAVQIASQACGALAYMHEHKIVHRDLKPQNIMICNDGSLRIMDFGIAKSTEMRRITFAGFSPAMGTLIIWPRNKSKESGVTNAPIFTASARCFTKWQQARSRSKAKIHSSS